MGVRGRTSPIQPASLIVVAPARLPARAVLEPLAEWCGLAAVSLTASARHARRRTNGAEATVAHPSGPLDQSRSQQWLRPPCERVGRWLDEVTVAPLATRADLPHVHASGAADTPSDTGKSSDAACRTTERSWSTGTGTAASPCWQCFSTRASSTPPEQSRALLEQIIRRDVLPTMRDQRLPAQSNAALPVLDEAAILLVQRLLAPSHNLAEAIEQVEAIGRPFGWTAIGCAGLFERCAQLLGDRWQEDVCSDLDVTLALGTLQAALHSMPLAPAASVETLDRAPKVLVATFPGELHRLGAALDRDVLGLAGWTVTSDDPANADDLQRLVGDQWLDALDLTLSGALRREHWLPRLAATIAGARAASCNPQLVVTVGGRLFAEDRDAWASVGADAGSVSAAGLGASIVMALRQVRVDWPVPARLAS